MYEYTKEGVIKARIWQDADKIESSAWDQIKILCEHPYIEDIVAIMPDNHSGIGVPIGSVVPVKDAVIPFAVGVDIGCGMLAIKTDITLDKITPKLKEIIHSIKRSVPLGFSWRENKNLKIVYDHIEPSIKTILGELKEYKNTINQLGTLGGGNHFIEIQKDDKDIIWIMIHSGSRNFGKLIADKYAKIAKEQAQFNIPKDLEVLDKGTDEYSDYMTLMSVAVQFAATNRRILSEAVKKEITYHIGNFGVFDVIHIPHNYAIEIGDTILHRKGATSANKGELGIIPGSMGSSSYIVNGLGNELSYNSCSHGAGRIMSRSRAKKEVSIDKFKESMGQIISEDINVGHLDEAPDVYKNIDEVMECQKDLVEIKVKLVPIGSVKG